MTAVDTVTEPEERGGAPLRVAVAGMGAVGMRLVTELGAGLPGFELGAIAVRDIAAAREKLGDDYAATPIVNVDELEPFADVVIECVPASLLRNTDLIDVARDNGGQIIVPSGALLGLDAVTAAAEGQIRSVKMTTRKPVTGLVGAPYLVENNINIADIKEPLRVFSGTARQAAIGFPANLNVAVALSLAGLGPDNTLLDIWADPKLTRNTHHIEVDSDSASFSMSIENIPTDNPKTGRITALSVIAALRKLRAPLRVGT